MPVYFILAGDDGPVKIGWANDVAARRKALQTSHHEPLRLLRIIEGRRQTERWLHECLCFAGQRMAGEWFWFHTDMATIEPPEFGPATHLVRAKAPAAEARFLEIYVLGW